MALVTLKYVLENARKNKYAVGSFNFFGLENLRGIVKAASENKSPVIAMASTGAVKVMGEKVVVVAAEKLSEEYGVDIVLHLDHCKDDLEMLKRCVDNGFTSVMIDASAYDYEENVRQTRLAVEYASRTGCSVEGEIGHIGGVEDEIVVSECEALFTVPEDAARFVADTGVDALAVAVGTVHGFYKLPPKLDFDRIKKIHELTPVPLVLHGGTGVPDDDFRKAIPLGVLKINVGTELKVNGYFNVMKDFTPQVKNSDPRKVALKIVDKCSEIVTEKINVFGSADRL
ncbi:class II fructose-bisphosphate aldolase [uncultured Sphaerochaeta sp.]|uniref:class II fructose-bisphosphate aldolase n=1 Tax=uncultured Sphaerochaeta sp. TaxID=886478 RepID=UPI002A0A90D0|nr:class II fructose-bisphosphate aldolase [uncultured Sphaerochaeta sp.]